MSPPSGKPFDPFDLSPYAPKRARERSAQPAVERDDDHASDGEDDREDEAAVALPYVPRAAMRPDAAGGPAGGLDAPAQAPSRPRPDAAAPPPATAPPAAPQPG